mgnify:CR=1 FL=1
MKAIDVIREQVEQGIILVRKDGKFWKIANKVNNQTESIPIEPKRMEVHLKSGYLGVVAWKDGKQYLMLAHRAMWELFVGAIPEGKDINHKNGNKQDNRLENLEVVSRSQNLKHAVRTGLKTYSNYPKQYSKEAKSLRSKGMSYAKIGKELGISQTAAFRAVNFEPTP